MDELERNKESLKIIKSIHQAETSASEKQFNRLKFFSFSYLKSLKPQNNLGIFSLKLFYFSFFIYFFNSLTILLNFHLLTFLTIIPSLGLGLVGSLFSFWCVHLQIVRFDVFGSKISGILGLTALCFQSLIWFFMSLGMIPGGSGGIFSFLSLFYAKNWLVFVSSILNLSFLLVSFTFSLILKQKIIQILLSK